MELFSILMYILPPVLSLAVLFVIKRRWSWLAVPITLLADLLVWGEGLFYNHGKFRDLILLFLIPQLLVTAALAFGAMALEKRRK